MATFEIGNVVLMPRCIRDESRLIRYFLSKPCNFAATFLAQGASLKPSVVARAAINGVIACDTESLAILNANGDVISFGDAARLVRSFQAAHTKKTKVILGKFKKECVRRCNVFTQKKAARVAAGTRAACKRILAALDADAQISGKQRRNIIAASRAEAAISQYRAEIFRKIKADKKAERAYNAQFYVPEARVLAPVRVPYVCPLRVNIDEDESPRIGRSFERSCESPIRRTRSEGDLPGNFFPRIESPIEDKQLLENIFRTCSRASALELHGDIKNFFREAPFKATTAMELISLARLAKSTLEYYNIFPSPMYFEPLRQLVDNSSSGQVLKCAESMENEMSMLRAIFKKDLTANSPLLFVAGLASGAASTLMCGIAGSKRIMDQGVAAFGKCCDKVVDTVEAATRKFGETMWDMVSKTFESCLGPYLRTLSHAREQIENYWRRAKAWVMSMWDKLSIEVHALFESTWWALGLILCAGVVVLAEHMLVSLGVLTHAGALTSLFITAFIGYLGWNFAAPATEAEGTLLTTVRALVHIVVEKPLGVFSSDQTANAPNALEFPLRVLETLGNGLLSAPLGTLQWLGKYGAAMDQIRRGKEAMKEFIGFCFDRIAEAWDNMTGRSDSFFREISSMVKVPIVPWIKSAQQIVLEAQTVAVTDPVLMDTITHLLYKGHLLQTTLAGAKRSTSLDYGRVVSSLVQELTKIRAQCARAGIFEGRRCEPFWVYIYGPSHCGKSLFMEEVSRRLLKENGHAPNDIYAKNARDSYWSGYLRQQCIQIDDLSACVTQPSVESEFLQTVGSKDYKLNMAAVEDKGMSFNSSIIITTSNVFTAPTDAQILDKAAYNNRRGAVVQCRHAPGVEFDPTNPSASCEARLVHVQDESPLCEWANCSKVLEMICQRNTKHRLKELTLMANYRERNDTLHPVHCGARNFLKSCTKSLGLGKLVCDGVVYEIDKPSGTCSAADEKPTVEYEMCAQHFIASLRQEISNRACDGMLNTFLNALIEGPCEVESVHKLNAASTTSQREFFLELPLLERVYLRCLQKQLHAIRDMPDFAFKVDIKHRILTSLRGGYDAVCQHGGKLLTIVAALVLILVIYSSFFSLYRTFISGPMDGVQSLVTIGALTANAGMVSSSYSSAGTTSLYSTRNIPVQYRNVHGMDLLANSNNASDDFLMSLALWLEIPGGGLISCIRGKGRYIYLTAHQAEQVPDGARVHASVRCKDGSVRTIQLIWEQKNVRKYSGTEAVTYHDAAFTALPEPHKSAFDCDIDQLPTLFDMNVVVVKRKNALKQVHPTLAALPAEQPIMDRWSSNGKLNREMVGINTYAYGGSYRNEIPISIASKCPTYAEDCGAILTTMWKGQRRVIGMHVASGYKNGCSKDWTSTATLLPALTDLDCNSGLNMVEETGVSYDGYRKIGYLPSKADRPYLTGKTMFVPVPDELKYIPTNLVERFSDGTEHKVTVEIKQPAILVADDPRIPTGISYDPLKQGMEKFKKPMDFLDEALCAEIAADISESWHDCFEDLEDCTDDVAINGAEDDFFDKFNMSTSEGYPWVKQRGIGESGKLRYFEETHDGQLAMRKDTPVYEAYTKLQEVSKNTIPELVCIETPKDECLPLRKITQKPKTRLFSILPLEYNLLLRKKFLSFAANLQQNRNVLPTQVGVDPYSREWGHIFARLRSKNSVAINCDYASFDGLITAQILRHIGNAINTVYKGDAISKKQRHNLLMAIVNRKSICGSQVYEVSAGIPSGCALTVLLNSIFNEMLIRYVWKVTITGVPREMFSHYVTLIVYGDDNLIAVHPEFLPSFNGMVIQRRLHEVGVTITDGSDKTAEGIYEKPFERLDFLKRRFAKQDDGTVLAPLDLASIYTSLQNVTLGAGSIPEAVRINVHVALTELYLHQNRVWFDDLRSFYAKGCGFENLPTWSQIHAFHREHLTGALPWAPHRMLDIPIDTPKLKRAMQSQGENDFVAQVCERIFVCGPAYKLPQGEQGAFIVDHIGRLRRGEHGVICPVSFNAEGKGRLPTQHWVNAFRSPKHHNTALILDAYNRGCNVYFRAEQPYVTNWLSAASFAMGLGMDYRAILHLYHNVCTPDAQCLDVYFQQARFRRVDRYLPPPMVSRN